MVLLTFVIGILNLCLGYALAVHLSYGPPSLPDGWNSLSASPPEHESQAIVREPSILKTWKMELAKGAAGMGNLADRLRGCEQQPDHEVIRQCVAELKELCEATLQEQGEAAGRFEADFSDQGQSGAAKQELEKAIYEQLAQLETTIGNLRQVDLESDLPAAGERLTGEIERVLAASRSLWHGLETTPSPS